MGGNRFNVFEVLGWNFGGDIIFGGLLVLLIL